MLAVLSPAKTLDMQAAAYGEQAAVRLTKPRDLATSEVIAELAKTWSVQDLRQRMGISEKLAELNRQRFSDMEFPQPRGGTVAAVLGFRGDVYRGLDVDHWTPDEMDYADGHLRILSGLYGVLRPRDAIQAYRLEMGTPIGPGPYETLYQHWSAKSSKRIAADVQKSDSDALLNLASAEYFKSLSALPRKIPVIAPEFLQWKDGKAKNITVFTKVARGTMATWVMRNRPRSEADLQTFAEDGYRFDAKRSEPGRPTFVRR